MDPGVIRRKPKACLRQGRETSDDSWALGLQREMHMAKISKMISPGVKQLFVMVSEFKMEVVLILNV